MAGRAEPGARLNKGATNRARLKSPIRIAADANHDPRAESDRLHLVILTGLGRRNPVAGTPLDQRSLR